jgi:superfamily I DNA and/or RNA helicase
MLVGDHTQPPPVSGEELRRWTGEIALAEGEAERVTALLAGSGFELLFTRAPEPNAIWLRTQRRMPRAIADFASGAFYQGGLRSEQRGASPDPLFSSPFAMVNTADRPTDDRDEQEAALIAQLVAHSHSHYRDWAVVVASDAQKELVTARLRDVLGSAARVDDNVSRVDGFQDGERDLIVFGFARSDTGSFPSPRQFNAAITRARRQLVVVGDADALRAAEDEGLRALVGSMLGHLGKQGDLRDSLHVEETLGSTAGQPA